MPEIKQNTSTAVDSGPAKGSLPPAVVNPREHGIEASSALDKALAPLSGEKTYTILPPSGGEALIPIDVAGADTNLTKKLDSPLTGKRLVMVDNEELLLMQYDLYLEPATGGTSRQVHHAGQSASQLVQEIAALKPEYILLDRQLDGLNGESLIPALRASCPDAKIVGFSNEKSNAPLFLAAGADTVILKTTNAAKTVEEIAAYVASVSA